MTSRLGVLLHHAIKLINHWWFKDLVTLHNYNHFKVALKWQNIGFHAKNACFK